MIRHAMAASLTLLATTATAADKLLENEPVAVIGKQIAEEDSIDYRHMGLYQLKQDLYYNPERYKASGGSYSSDNTNHIEHTHRHHHDHIGYGLASYPYPSGSHSSSSNSESFLSQVGSGLESIAVLATIIAVTSAVAYSGYQLLTLPWPYIGATSLTAIELPANSPWKITGYRIANGKAMTYRHFEGNEETMEVIKEGNMFDRHDNTSGRFVLLDQENWWGATDYPLDADIIFSRNHDDGTEEKITVNFKRSITNGAKAGTVSTSIKSGGKQSLLQTPHSYSIKTHYPGQFFAIHNWSNWYHLPTRVVVDFHPIASY